MRVTKKDLQNKIDYLNELTDNNKKPYEFGKGWKRGTYLLSGAYGGYKLEQVVNDGGGVRDVLYTGFTTKKDLYKNVCSYVNGLYDSKK